MGIPLTIYSLYQLQGAGCRHHLLLRVEQPAFSNADAGEYDHAVVVAEEKRRALLQTYERDVLPLECTAAHAASLAGELQASPAGEEMLEGRAGTHVDLWVAETRFGPPWVVMGAAEDEDAFWRQVEADDDLSSLGPVRPAVKRRAFFLAEAAGGTLT